MLRCNGISKSFDGVRVLTGVTAAFAPQGVVAIVGPNGAGKTTLLNVITGFARADEGSCFLGEREITRMAAHRIAQLGIARTFQDLRLIASVPVLENVMLARPHQRGEKLLYALFRSGVAKEEAANRMEALRMLEFVGLEQRANELAGELSYGQQKLMTLACCLATEAKVLLLDEPVSGVHPEMVDKIVSLMKKLKEMGNLVIFVEHDLAAVRVAADRVIVMDQGKIIADGEPGEVLGRAEIMEAYIG
jgi:ABC-type branched-subunit amino acid transport system ATPase component